MSLNVVVTAPASPNSGGGPWEHCYLSIAANDPGSRGCGPLKILPSMDRVCEDWELRTHIAATAAMVGLPQRTLTARFFLYVPRLINAGESLDGTLLAEEITSVACEWGRRVEVFSSFLEPPTIPVTNPRHLEFGRIATELARIIHENFHYIGSFRGDGTHFGLTLSVGNVDRLAALVTISPCDLTILERHLPTGMSLEQVRVASRIFAFDWAPPNTISFILAQAARALRSIDNPPELLVTYVNPNLGFRGDSMRASNWRLLGRDWSSTRLSYVGKRYMTERELRGNFGTSDPDVLATTVSGFQLSPPLEPLEIWGFPLSRRMQHHFQTALPTALDLGLKP